MDGIKYTILLSNYEEIFNVGNMSIYIFKS